jgi:predicted transposase YbfD/YdcC
LDFGLESVKDNQPTLCCKVEAVCNDTKPLSCAQTVDSKKRNRHETRTVAVFNARPAVAGTEWQPHVAAIIAIERNVLTFRPATGLWDASRETALYLSNRPIRARKAADAVRKHWGIENKQHYTRDVTLREDASRIRRNPGIFARLRSFAYNILLQSIRHHRPGSLCRCLGGLEALSDMNYYKER